MSIETSAGIGAGCSSLSNCNGFGTCDHCLQKCVCNPGHGADTDPGGELMAADWSGTRLPSASRGVPGWASDRGELGDSYKVAPPIMVTDLVFETKRDSLSRKNKAASFRLEMQRSEIEFGSARSYWGSWQLGEISIRGVELLPSLGSGTSVVSRSRTRGVDELQGRGVVVRCTGTHLLTH